MNENCHPPTKFSIHGRNCYIFPQKATVLVKNKPDKDHLIEFGTYFVSSLKDLMILYLRAQGYSMKKIASKLGYKNKSSVQERLYELSKANSQISNTELICRAKELELLRPFALFGIAAISNKFVGKNPLKFIIGSYSAQEAKYIAIIPTTRIHKLKIK